MREERINKAIEILDHAIKNNLSMSEASIQSGYAGTYVKNVKMIAKEKFEDEMSISQEDCAYGRLLAKVTEYEESKGRSVVSKNNLQTKQDSEVNVGNPQKGIATGEKLRVNISGNIGDINWQGSDENFKKMFTPETTLGEGDKKGDSPVEGTKFHLGYPEGHVKTLDNLLDKCDVDRDIWDVESYLVNKWDVTSWKHGEPQTWENFQVKARLTIKEAQKKAKTAGEIFRDMTENYKPPVVELNFKSCVDEDGEENNILEIALFDLHYGKLSWNGETGEDYDTKIAKKRFVYAIKKLIQRSSGFKIKRVLFPIGNDFFNSDNRENTTSHGTPQDEDLRWQKTFQSGCELIVDGINIIKQLGVPVDVLVIPGNHDFERSFYLGTFVSAWFRNDKQVNVDNRAKPRKYYQWGKVLLGFTHGKEEKENSLPMLMARDKDSKALWSETEFHEWHLGHFHRKKTKKFTILDKTGYVDEEEGVIVRYLSSLTGTEEWHFLKGFVGQIKAGEAFIFNDKSGMIGHFNANYVFEGTEEEGNDVETLLNK